MIPRTLIAVYFLVAAVAPAAAERLAVHAYTVADGLAGDQITTVVRDSRGFLWIGTRTGLSRFDGVGFRSFGTADGLPHESVWSLLEAADGTLYVGTRTGLVRMLPERSADGLAFAPVPGAPDRIAALAETRDGRIWAASRGELVKCGPDPDEPCTVQHTGIQWQPGDGRSIEDVAVTPDGALWLGSSRGLYRVAPDGSVTRIELPAERLRGPIRGLLVDSRGRLWVAGHEIAVIEQPPTGKLPAVLAGNADWFRLEPAIDGAAIFDLDEGPDGRIWVTSHNGLCVISTDTVSDYDRASGLLTDHLSSVLVDGVGNAWIGTEAFGLMRINSTGFTSFTESDGLVASRMAAVTLGPSGEVVAISQPPEAAIHLYDDGRFVPLSISLPDFAPRHGWGMNQVTFFDHEGKLWVPTPSGVFRFPRLADLHDLPSTRYEARYLAGNEVFRLFEDGRGDVWLGAFNASRLVRWERATDTLHHYGTDDGVPFQAGTAFAEDRSGAVWIGFYSGKLTRWRDGHFDVFDRSDGLPTGMVNCLFVDSSGRLWVGAHGRGLAVTDDPTAARPRWRLMGPGVGLAGEAVFSLAEDRFGRIYVGTLKGLDRLDPDGGRIEHFDTSSGLVNNLVMSALATPDGDLWFATSGGVSRFRPHADTPRPPPPVFIDRITVDGIARAVPLRGAPDIPEISLPARTEVVEIGFAAVDLTPGSRLAFEFSVDDGAIWASTHGSREVRLAGLGAGHRTIAIRSRQPDGDIGPAARVHVEIATPVWRRWWFLTAAVALAAAGAWTVQRQRMLRLEELHRMRSRIAADLHDEMGLSLARIAILADVAGGDTPDPATTETLSEIGETARDLVDATSDMAWALDPRHDSVVALVARLRRTASEVAEGAGARFVVDSDPLASFHIAPEARRHLYLILKEAIRNACRHGAASEVTLTIRRQPSGMLLTVADDGDGFDLGGAVAGQGLASMRRRAEDMGAELVIDSRPGAGTRIELRAPLQTDA